MLDFILYKISFSLYLSELPHDMTEPVEELQEGVLRARSDRVITTNVSRELYEDDKDTEDDYDNLSRKLEELLEDLKACDAQVKVYPVTCSLEMKMIFSALFICRGQFKL